MVNQHFEPPFRRILFCFFSVAFFRVAFLQGFSPRFFKHRLTSDSWKVWDEIFKWRFGVMSFWKVWTLKKFPQSLTKTTFRKAGRGHGGFLKACCLNDFKFLLDFNRNLR